MRVEREEAAKLEELERSLHRHGVRSSTRAVDELLAEDFLEIGSSGRVYDKAQITALLAAETGVLSVETDTFAFRKLAEGVVLVTYTTRITNEAETRSALRSSIWRKTNGRWKIVFHQGTPTDIPWIETA